MMDASKQLTQPLIRQEALDAAGVRNCGSISITQPIQNRIIALCVTCAIGAFFGVLIVGEYTRKATAHGLIAPTTGIVRVMAPITGTLSSIQIEEGQEITRETPLFSISETQTTKHGKTRELISEQLTSQSALLKEKAEEIQKEHSEKIQSLELKIRSIRTRIELASEELNISAKIVNAGYVRLRQKKSLQGLGLLSAADVIEYERELLTTDLDRNRIKSRKKLLEQECIDHIAIQKELEFKLHTDLRNVHEKDLALNREIVENENRREQVVTAEAAGVIGSINYKTGQLVQANSVLANLTPQNSQLHAVLYLSSAQAGFVKPGQKVKVKYLAYPFQKFGMGQGVVEEIFRSPLLTEELPSHHANQLSTKELYYRVTVKLNSQYISTYGELTPLKAGLTLEADIIQETRKLYEWLLEPIYSVQSGNS